MVHRLGRMDTLLIQWISLLVWLILIKSIRQDSNILRNHCLDLIYNKLSRLNHLLSDTQKLNCIFYLHTQRIFSILLDWKFGSTQHKNLLWKDQMWEVGKAERFDFTLLLEERMIHSLMLSLVDRRCRVQFCFQCLWLNLHSKISSKNSQSSLDLFKG